MQSKAIARFVRCSPRKVSQVLMLVRGKKVEKAFEILSFIPKFAGVFIKNVLKSAASNAGALKDCSSLRIKEAWVGCGPILKRMRAGPRGRSMPIKKRTTHLTIIVTDVGVLAEKKRDKNKYNLCEKGR
jgi:large subunit ribosomal protein L22